MTELIGSLVRLEGLTISQLPHGGKGMKPSKEVPSTEKFSDGSGATAPPNVKTFVANALSEAIPFIDGVAPKSGAPTARWKHKGGPRKCSSSDAPVHSYERAVAGKDLDKLDGMTKFSADRKDEMWHCRLSCHRNATEKGTASWDEFVHSFKEHHSKCEESFTPTIIGARHAMIWDTRGLEVEVHGARWINIKVTIEESKHRIEPKPLKNRVFSVIQITAALAGVQEFVVVSIPIQDFFKSPYSEYSRDKSLVAAAYAAVERIRVLPDTGEIEWIMATASNAGGILPQWMQKLAVPAAIAKDVDFFMAWIPGQRGARDVPVAAPAPATFSEKADKANAPANSHPQFPPSDAKNGHKPTVSTAESMRKELPPPAKDKEQKPTLSRTGSIKKELPPPVMVREHKPTISRAESMKKELPPPPPI